MVKYPKEKTIRGLPYDLVSTHDDKFKAKYLKLKYMIEYLK
mgnify:CR=1 FL=1